MAGLPYYYDGENEEITWEKPDELRTPEEIEAQSGEWVGACDCFAFDEVPPFSHYDLLVSKRIGRSGFLTPLSCGSLLVF